MKSIDAQTALEMNYYEKQRVETMPCTKFIGSVAGYLIILFLKSYVKLRRMSGGAKWIRC